jgi:dGTPase
MREFGGFEHNLQSLRVVDQLEERYPNFDGLNLTFETREGILKHCSLANAKLLEVAEPAYGDGEAGIGSRFLLHRQPSLEAQLCNLADEIAYNAHDIDDGVRSGLITPMHLKDVEMYEEFQQAALSANPHLAKANFARRLLYETIRLMLSQQVYDVIDSTQLALQEAKPQSVSEVRLAGPLVVFSDAMEDKSKILKRFLFQHLYRHPKVEETMSQAKRVVRELFGYYCESPVEMQAMSASRCEIELRTETAVSLPSARVVADYIAGMTDRFAAKEHERLSGKRLIT